MLTTHDQIYQLIEDLDDLEIFPDLITLSSAHFAALELVELGHTAFDLVVDALQHHPKYTVRGWLAWILGEIGDKRAIPALNVAVHNDPHHYVRLEAQIALAVLLH